MTTDNSKKRHIEKNFVGGDSDKVHYADANFAGGDSSKVAKTNNENFVGGDKTKVKPKDPPPSET